MKTTTEPPTSDVGPQRPAASRRLSLRDPDGCLVAVGDRLVRLVHRSGADSIEAFLEAAWLDELRESGRIVRTWRLDHDDPDAAIGAVLGARAPEDSATVPVIVEHERVPFPSYAHEWPAEMLYEAGRLTLDIARRGLDAGYGLKDATPYNVLFDGAKPVFVDALSLERRAPEDAVWLAAAQFARTFTLPLLAERLFGIPSSETFLAHRDGLNPERLYLLGCGLRRLNPTFFGTVVLPRWLDRPGRGRLPHRVGPTYGSDKTRFILHHTYRRIGRGLDRARPRRSRRSAWSDYMNDNTYTTRGLAHKEAWLGAIASRSRSNRALDVGCNTGHFSQVLARAGARVVGIDVDPVVVGAASRRSSEASLDILPLVGNIARPAPALGWRNGECTAFLERARGRFDLVVLFAVLHHLLVTEGIPLEEIVALIADLTNDLAAVEFVAPEDPMFRRLARGRDRLFTSLDRPRFEIACAKHFEIVTSEPLADSSTRFLYLLRRKSL